MNTRFRAYGNVYYRGVIRRGRPTSTIPAVMVGWGYTAGRTLGYCLPDAGRSPSRPPYDENRKFLRSSCDARSSPSSDGGRGFQMARDEVAREWYNKYHDEGKTQAQIAEQYDASQSTVSRVIAAYDDGKEQGREKGVEEGRESVEPTEFGREVLESALADKKEDDDEYSCGECGSAVEYMADQCPDCGAGFNWDAL